MKLLLLHSSATNYKLLATRFRLPRHHLHRLPPFPGQLIPIPMEKVQKKNKTPDFTLTVEEIEKQGIRSVLLVSPTRHLLDILDEAAVFHPNILHAVLCIFHSDPTRRRVFVTGLPVETTADGLREFFSRYGAVEEAEVVARGEYGRVVFGNVEAVQRAIKAPGEEIAAALGSGGCCRVCVEWEGDEDDEERRKRRKKEEKSIWLGLGQVPLRRVVFVPIVYQ